MLRKFAIFMAAAFGFLMLMPEDASAQKRRVVRVYRPVIVRPYYSPFYDPFWHSRYSLWNDPYFYDPYLRERREKYYLEADVREERKDLKEDQEKYAKDGVITAKEQEKLLKQQRKLNEAIAKLNRFNAERN